MATMASSLPASFTGIDEPAVAQRKPPWRLLLWTWLAFWLLLFVLGAQEYLWSGGRQFWRPLVDYGTAALVATALAAMQIRRSRALRPPARPAGALVPAHVGLDAAAAGRPSSPRCTCCASSLYALAGERFQPGWRLEVLRLRGVQVHPLLRAPGRHPVRPAFVPRLGERAAAHRAAGAPRAAGPAGAADAAAAAALPVQRAEHGVVADPQRPGPGRYAAHPPGDLAARRHRRRPAPGAAARRRAGAAARLRRHHDPALRRSGRDPLGGRPRRRALQRADARPAAAARELLSPRRRAAPRAHPRGRARRARARARCASRSRTTATCRRCPTARGVGLGNLERRLQSLHGTQAQPRPFGCARAAA